MSGNTDAPFGSLNTHWHPGEDDAYLTAAIARVRARLAITETAAMTTTMPPAIATRPAEPRKEPHTMPEPLTAHHVAQPLTAMQHPDDDQHAALLAWMYGPHGGCAWRVALICRTHRRRRDAELRMLARAQREGEARDVA